MTGEGVERPAPTKMADRSRERERRHRQRNKTVLGMSSGVSLIPTRSREKRTESASLAAGADVVYGACHQARRPTRSSRGRGEREAAKRRGGSISGGQKMEHHGVIPQSAHESLSSCGAT